ncbi:tyrosine-protein phosphatase non-receptor type 4 isoform X1 [Procambarus clarkii]|uniref:tyrosine-protein phosphatase non-receptor type 4-like isoform X4 n=2 Tax=Procambarus clarkii TaxID=6728 RepID=UPI001E6751B4|nr:tyrosine-protein phosphatase non-receptor type 4-like isoform X4 [Procambarus clarkii]
MLLFMVLPSRLPHFVHICLLQEGMLEGVSRRTFGGSSGTYNVRASELARHKALKTLRVQVALLDDSTQVFEIEKRAKGQALLDLVFNHLELIERDFFGLQYIEPSTSNENPKRWLDPLKPVKKQLRIRTKSLGTCGLPVLYFRVKFWVSDPGKLTEEYTRYHVFLQLRRDVLEGRLGVQPSTAALLASYALQSELGDYILEEHGNTYLADMRLVPNQTDELEKKIMELHKLHKGQTPADAEFNFLDHAKRLDLYGVDLHKVRDSTNREIHLGVTAIGLVVFQNAIKINTFSWAKIVKISFKRKQFFIQLRREVTDQADSKEDPSSFLQIFKKKLYTKSENYDSVLGFNLASYRACKCLWKSCVEHHTFFRLHTPRTPARKNLLTLGSKFRYSGRTEFQTVEECKRRARVERTFVRSPSKRFARQTVPTPSELGRKARSGSGSSLRPRTDSSGYKVTSLQGAKTPKMAWGEAQTPDDENGLTEREDVDRGAGVAEDGVGVVRPLAPPPAPPSTSSSSASSAESDVGASPSPDHQPGGSEESAHGLVTIRMKPDDGGKFGFNVKGGADQNLPVLVSRVAPNTPADRCYPRLNEGDQVLLINGRDVSAMTHEQVVNFIRASRECHSGELVLTVKQNVYLAEELEEPAFQYVPEALPTTVSVGVAGSQTAPLHESMLLLSEGLEAGSLVAQFEQLYRRKPGLTVTHARRPENEKKNRYRDISPYDTTRVILTYSASCEYINASYVNMEIQGSGIVNRYIACQGPLTGTCTDFWQMVWEQQSTLIVMLTTVVEQGRVKCHRYWPRLYETVDFGTLHVTCLKEEETPGFAYREFTLINTENQIERHITHMQYLAWPDHGVPDDSTEFLNFVTQVRQARTGMVEPTIVHCSAGIGRTGVLILMETAQCLIEANEPVYPLDVVRAMRDQRAMMIQTASQFRFVCEAIQRVYSEGLIKPMAEYQQR